MDPPIVTHVLAACALLVTHFVGAIACFGSSLLAVPILLLLYGRENLSQLVLLMVAIGAAQSWLIVARTWRDVSLQALLALLGGALVGLPAGAWLAPLLPAEPVYTLLGVLLIAAGALQLKGAPSSSVAGGQSASSVTTVVAGMAGGVIHGGFASGGVVLAAYAQRLLLDPATFRATLAALWSALNAVFLAMALALAPPSLADVTVVVCVTVPVLLVSLLGDMAARRLNRRVFRCGVSALLILAGMALAVKGVSGPTVHAMLLPITEEYV